MQQYWSVKFILAVLIGLGSQVSVALAQSDFDEMDLLLMENKAENKPTPKNKKNNLDLKDTLAKNKETDSKNKPESESWLKSLISKGTAEIFGEPSEEELKEEKERIQEIMMKKRSNAANFDISGVKLRMSPTEVEQVMSKSGFHKITENLEIPNFIKWRSEELCRQHGILGMERLAACAIQMGKANGYQFVEKQLYTRFFTKEQIEVSFTSTFTNNLAYRIHYKSKVPMSTGNSSKSVYLNNIKVFDFWQRIDQKYGKPDNETEIKWGLGGKKPFLQASTGELELADPLLKNLDGTRMFNEDTRIANTPYYTF